jgi:hypothetical protein
LRVVAYGGRELESLRADLERFGCVTEADARRHLVAVSVPAAASLSVVRAYLDEKHGHGELDYEEPISRGS